MPVQHIIFNSFEFWLFNPVYIYKKMFYLKVYTYTVRHKQKAWKKNIDLELIEAKGRYDVDFCSDDLIGKFGM